MNDSAGKNQTVPMSAVRSQRRPLARFPQSGTAGRTSVPARLMAGNDMLFEFKIRTEIPTPLTT